MGFVFFGLLCLIFMYLYVSNNLLRINRVTLGQISSQHPPIKYIHITDIHGKIKFLNGSLSELINKEEVDFILLTGDLIHEFRDLDRVIEALKAIKVKIFVVLGNNERQCTAFNELCELISATENLTLLINEEVHIDLKGYKIGIYGFDNSLYGNERYHPSNETHDYKIILAHSPSIISFIENFNVTYNHLLVGHTHGGQIRIGNLPLTPYARFHVGDKFHEDGSIFSINKGIGTSRLPLRINATPEIRVYEVYVRWIGG